ncbi:MAG TPA: septum formation initiator family protein [Actinomycetota bacterium]|nr:septum formation initiator family protein [Actinomycetota bacterium]
MTARAVHARPRARLTPRGAILAVLVVALAMALAVPLRQYFEQRAEIAGLERRLVELRAERDALEAKIRRLNDPAHLERVARRCLGMVRPGEIPFVTVPESGRPRPSRC